MSHSCIFPPQSRWQILISIPFSVLDAHSIGTVRQRHCSFYYVRSHGIRLTSRWQATLQSGTPTTVLRTLAFDRLLSIAPRTVTSHRYKTSQKKGNRLLVFCRTKGTSVDNQHLQPYYSSAPSGPSCHKHTHPSSAHRPWDFFEIARQQASLLRWSPLKRPKQSLCVANRHRPATGNSSRLSGVRRKSANPQPLSETTEEGNKKRVTLSFLMSKAWIKNTADGRDFISYQHPHSNEAVGERLLWISDAFQRPTSSRSLYCAHIGISAQYATFVRDNLYFSWAKWILDCLQSKSAGFSCLYPNSSMSSGLHWNRHFLLFLLSLLRLPQDSKHKVVCILSMFTEGTSR